MFFEGLIVSQVGFYRVFCFNKILPFFLQDMSQTMSEFVCDGCRAADEGKEKQLYCLCQQPYDESQFYICCDRCQVPNNPDSLNRFYN